MVKQVHDHIRQKFNIASDDTSYPLSGSRDTNRGELILLFKSLGYKIGAEIGVREGEFSKTILDGIKGVELFCIDPWVIYNEIQSERKINRQYHTTVDVLSPYKNAKIIRKKSQDSLALFKDRSLDFVYIDASHDFENVLSDIIGWTEKVRVGGIVSGHDYVKVSRHRVTFGVIRAVDAYVKAHSLCLYVTKDKYPSWFFVKE